MLFTQHINTLNADITSVQNRIDELEDILKGLRSGKANLEAQLQQILTLEGAAESAINQAQSFVNAAESLNRDDLIATFWQAMETMKNGAVAQLPASQEPTEPEPETEPVNPNSDNEAITVDVEDSWSDLGVDLQLSESEIDELEPQSEEKQLQSVGSAAFDIKSASIEQLKGYCLDYITEDTARTYGSLTRKATWKAIAKAISEGKLQPLNS